MTVNLILLLVALLLCVSSVCKKTEVPGPCNPKEHQISGVVQASLERNWIMFPSCSSQSVMGMQRLGLLFLLSSCFFLLSFFAQSL